MKEIEIRHEDILKKVKLLPRYVNREVQQKHVNSLKKSIKSLGVVRDVILAEIPHIQKDVYFNIDGQHLSQACYEMKLGYKAKVITIKDESDLIKKISLLNSTAKNWKLNDYLNAWVTAKKPAYIHLKEKMKELKINAISGFLDAYGTTTANNGAGIAVFKEGDLKIDVERGDDIITIYKKMVGIGLIKNSNSLRAVVRFINKNGIGSQKKLEIIVQKNLNIFSQNINKDTMFDYFEFHYKNLQN
jgi:hypothetical protein